MTTTPDTHDARALELQARSLDALASLLHALDASNDVDDVAKRALLTLSGQLLIQRAAFFVDDGGILQLRATVGVGRNRVTPATWRLPKAIETRFTESEGGVIELETVRGCLDEDIAGNFDRLARLSNGTQTVGVVLLGGWLGSRELGESDRQLLRTMGVVIGTTLHRVTVQEELVRARQGLEHAQLIRKSVMDHVSHEFNTPLMVVKSVGDLLGEASDEDRVSFLEMHRQSVQRLEQLVGSILQVTREVGGDACAERLDLPHFVEQVVRPCLLRSWEDQCRVVSSHDDTGGVVHADALRVEMVLHALHSNSNKASEDGNLRVWTNVYVAPRGWWDEQDHVGRLSSYRVLRSAPPEATLGLGPVEVRAGTARELVMEVVDLGRGIPAADLERVFDAFVQASNSANLGVSGAGMGLSTARKLANELSGRLLLRSQEGTGTIAALLLPLSDLVADPRP